MITAAGENLALSQTLKMAHEGADEFAGAPRQYTEHLFWPRRYRYSRRWQVRADGDAEFQELSTRPREVTPDFCHLCIKIASFSWAFSFL